MKPTPSKWVLRLKKGRKEIVPLSSTIIEPHGVVIVYGSGGEMVGVVNPFTRMFKALQLEAN